MRNNNELYDIEKVIRGTIAKRLSRYKAVPPHLMPSRDELYQLGYIGYLRALKNAKPEYGLMPLSYAQIYIDDEVTRGLNKQLEYSFKHSSLDIEDEDGERCNYYDIYFNRDDHEDADKAKPIDDIIEIIHNNPERYTKRERDIMGYKYFAEPALTLKEIGDIYGVSLERIRQIINATLEKIKEDLKIEV